MKKLIYASKLLELLQAEIEEHGEPAGNVYGLIKSLVKKCPSAYSGENVIMLPIALNQTVWTKDGRRGKVSAFYVGKQGVQRIFVRLDDGSQLNCSAKGLGLDIYTERPAQGDGA